MRSGLCSSFISVAGMKFSDLKQLKERGLFEFHLPGNSPLGMEVKGGSQG